MPTAAANLLRRWTVCGGRGRAAVCDGWLEMDAAYR
jgi:hypothetical protein